VVGVGKNGKRLKHSGGLKLKKQKVKLLMSVERPEVGKFGELTTGERATVDELD